MKKGNYEHLIIDTAGRLVADEKLMIELEEISKIVKPNYKYLILDAMTGQQAIEIAKIFNNRIGFDGAIITKADSESRFGAAVAFRFLLKNYPKNSFSCVSDAKTFNVIYITLRLIFYFLSLNNSSHLVTIRHNVI